MSEPRPRLRVTCSCGWEREASADGAVEIAVTDTGIGIASEDQAAIFEEFRQVGSDETRKQEGTGLGLTLAKKFSCEPHAAVMP